MKQNSILSSSTRASTRDRILKAGSTSEVNQLLSAARFFKKISSRTLRQLEYAAECRKAQLTNGGAQ